MKITKYDHSTFYIEKDGRGLLFDPVEYTTKLPEFDNLDVIIITHKHGDHYQPEVLNKILANNPDAKLYSTADARIEGASIAEPGLSIIIGGFEVEFYGTGNHASIMDGIVPCENIGVMINQTIVNPGDSFDATLVNRPKVLLTPVSAPWLKIEDVIHFIRNTKPEIIINTHDGLLSEMGASITNNMVSAEAKAVGAVYKHLNPTDSIDF